MNSYTTTVVMCHVTNAYMQRGAVPLMSIDIKRSYLLVPKSG